MSSIRDLSELSREALIEIITSLKRDGSGSPQNESILHHRNRLLSEENANFRSEIDELKVYKMQYYQCKTSIEEYNSKISQLKSQNNELMQQLQESKSFAARCKEKEQHIEHAAAQKKSLMEELEHYKIAHAQYQDGEHTIHQMQSQISALKDENSHLHEDLLRGERLHATKYETVNDKLNTYHTKYNDLLQKYSSMESFVEEFCEYANESDDDEHINENVMEQLTKWSALLQHKQHHIEHEISQKVEYQLSDMQYAVHHNQKQMAHNVAESVLSDVICNVVTTCCNERISGFNEAAEKISVDQNEIQSNKMLMQSQVTQLNGQKQIIATLNGTIKDLCAKVKEYEHHIHRLSLQLKQLSLINQAAQQTNTDFNVQQIQELSHQLMEKEIEIDTMKHRMEIKEKEITEYTDKIMDIQNTLGLKNKECEDIRDEYDHLKHECQQFEAEYSELQEENETWKDKYSQHNTAYRDLETEYDCIKNKLLAMQKQCNKLKQNEFNFKFKEQTFKEQYQMEFDHFNKEYDKLQKNVELLQHTNLSLQKEVDQYHSALINHKEQAKTVNMKYTKLKYEYERVQFTLKETTKQVKQKSDGMHDNSAEVDTLKGENERLQQKLAEGSNIRRELRSFVGKCQQEAQTKLDRSYKKLTFMKQLILSTYKVLSKERQFVDKNNALRHHLEYLRNTLHENQENHSQNI